MPSSERRRPGSTGPGAVVVAVAVLVASAGPAPADDWPQWMGPGRDNQWREEGIVDTFAEGGPPVSWRTPIAGGYAGPAVAGGRVFVTDYLTSDDVKVANFDRESSTGVERVLCLDEQTGRVLWKHEYPVTYTISYPAGPRCTPVVEAERVYTLGAEGHLLCLDVADGRVIWSRDLKKDYETRAALWGYASHPLIDGDKLVCVVGTSTAHAAAFHTATGAEIWRTGRAPEQGYSPPTIIEHAGTRQLVFLKPDGIYAVVPETGAVLWEAAYGADNGSIIMAPVKVGPHLFVGGFQDKNLLLELRGEPPVAATVWRDKKQHGLAAINVQPFPADGHIYGFHEKGDLRAVEIPSGKVVWSGGGPFAGRLQGSATAFIVRQSGPSAPADRYWLFTETGDLVIARLSPAGYEEIDRAHLIEPTNTAFGRQVVWCAPAYANRAVLVRNDEEIIRVSLARGGSPAATAP